MIDREGRSIVLTCDSCGRRVAVFDTFEEARVYAVECGWTAQKTRDGWENTCAECREGDEL